MIVDGWTHVGDRKKELLCPQDRSVFHRFPRTLLWDVVSIADDDQPVVDVNLNTPARRRCGIAP